MNNLQIDRIIYNTPTTKSGYLGCFSARDMPMSPRIGFMVINVSTSTSDMGHWVMFYSNGQRIIFLDSFGFSPNVYAGNISEYFNSFEYCTVAINKAIQNNHSYVCGAYCIYYIYYLCKNISLGVINRRFHTKTKLRNDIKVEKFVMNLTNTRQTCVRDMCSLYTFNTKCEKICNCNSPE
jgi:hypothetical protein